MFFTPDENFSPSAEQVDAIKNVFDTYPTYNLEEMAQVQDMGLPPDGERIANTAIMSLAAGSATFRGFCEFSGVEEEDSEFYTPGPIHSIGLDMQDGINKAYQSLSGDVPLGLDGKDVLAWLDGGGAEPTAQHISDMAKLMAVVHYGVEVMKGAVVTIMRPGDDLDGNVFAYAAWQHYIQENLGSCNCSYMQAGYQTGIELDRISEEFDHVVDRLRSDEQRVTTLTNTKPMADEVGDDVSSDLQDMLGNAGSMMN